MGLITVSSSVREIVIAPSGSEERRSSALTKKCVRFCVESFQKVRCDLVSREYASLFKIIDQRNEGFPDDLPSFSVCTSLVLNI